MANYTLTDLIDSEVLQQVQDGFEKYTGLNAIITDSEVKAATRGEGFNEFSKVLLEQTNDEKKPRKIKEKFLTALKKGSTLSYKKGEGFYQVASPIMFENEFLGLFICGSSQAQDGEKSTPEQIKRGAKFLSTITGVLSRIAYENYISFSDSTTTQESAKVKNAAIAETAVKLKKSMQEWTSVINEALETDDLDIIKKKLKQVLLKGSEVYNVVDYSVKEIQSNEETVSLFENEYNLRRLVPQEIERVQKNAKGKNIEFSHEIGDSVSQILFGDHDRIIQIVYTLFKCSADRIQSGRIGIDFSCENVFYAKMLVIRYTDLTQGLSDDDLNALQMFIATSDESYLKKSAAPIQGYSKIDKLVRQVFGVIDLDILSEGQMEFLVKIPQLEIEVEELEG